MRRENSAANAPNVGTPVAACTVLAARTRVVLNSRLNNAYLLSP